MKMTSSGVAWRSSARASPTVCVMTAPGAGICSGGMARELAGAVGITRSARGNSKRRHFGDVFIAHDAVDDPDAAPGVESADVFGQRARSRRIVRAVENDFGVLAKRAPAGPASACARSPPARRRARAARWRRCARFPPGARLPADTRSCWPRNRKRLPRASRSQIFDGPVARQRVRCLGVRAQNRLGLRRLLGENRRHARLQNACFFSRDLRDGIAQENLVIEIDRRDDATAPA